MLSIAAAGASSCALGARPPAAEAIDAGADAGPRFPRPDASSPQDGAGGEGADAGFDPDAPPAACGPVTGAYGGLQMIACVPEGMEGGGGAPAPLVVALHGYTQSAAAYRETTQWDVLAGRYRFYVVFAQAPGNRAFLWYTSGRDRGQPDPAGIVAMVDAMKQTHAIDPARVFVTGLSAGGYMAISLLADYPDVFAAGAAVSGGAHGCGVTCPSLPSGGTTGSAVKAAYPSWWNDASRPKPRLMLMHGTADQVNVIGNMEHATRQWLAALGADETPDNGALGLPDSLAGYPLTAYEQDGRAAVVNIVLDGLGHGTPVSPGDRVDQGGYDPDPSQTADSCYTCPQDWTNTGAIYGPYQEARFFGIIE